MTITVNSPDTVTVAVTAPLHPSSYTRVKYAVHLPTGNIWSQVTNNRGAAMGVAYPDPDSDSGELKLIRVLDREQAISILTAATDNKELQWLHSPDFSMPAGATLTALIAHRALWNAWLQTWRDLVEQERLKHSTRTKQRERREEIDSNSKRRTVEESILGIGDWVLCPETGVIGRIIEEDVIGYGKRSLLPVWVLDVGGGMQQVELKRGVELVEKAERKEDS